MHAEVLTSLNEARKMWLEVTFDRDTVSNQTAIFIKQKQPRQSKKPNMCLYETRGPVLLANTKYEDHGDPWDTIEESDFFAMGILLRDGLSYLEALGSDPGQLC